MTQQLSTDKISATFVDFSEKTNVYGIVLLRDPAFWRAELEDMRDAGIKNIIIARSVVSGRAHYHSALIPEWNEQDLVRLLFETAASVGLGVYLGLDLNLSFWDRSRDFGRMMQRDLAWNRLIAEELVPLYRGHPSLRGIYVSNELDRDNLDTPERLEAVQIFMSELYSDIKQTFDVPVLSSPFFSKAIPFEQLADWWDHALDRPMLDILAMQDGVGCRYRHIDPGDVAEFYQHLAPVLASHGIRFWNNVETFALSEHACPLDPAPMERINAQFTAGAPFVEASITWEYGHFLGRQQVDEARYLDFRRWNLGQETL